MSRIYSSKTLSLLLIALFIGTITAFLARGTATAASPTLLLEPLITEGLNSPVDITGSGIPTDDRLFVVERFGYIRVIDAGGTLLSQPFLDISDRINQGILGITFDPNYADNGYFYVFYNYLDSEGEMGSRLSRFQRSSTNPDVADPAGESILLSFPQPRFDHSGGSLHFGPDGYLYVATGDGGSGSEQAFNGQAADVLLGKILRLDLHSENGYPSECDPAGAYAIPAENPLRDGAGGACDEIWALGLRNPWRFSFDRVTGEMWIADVGQDQREEINFEPTGSSGGRNYGWTCYEGTEPYLLSGCAPAEEYDFPIYEYDHTLGCSITGGYVYRGELQPAYEGHYFFADFCSANFWSLYRSGDGAYVSFWEIDSALPLASPVSFGEDNDGELLLVDLNGNIFRISMSGTPTAIQLANSIRTAGGSSSIPILGMAAVALMTMLFWRGTRDARR